MAVRTDITVDWESSPRIVTVLSPSTEVTIQDLHDTLAYLEQLPLNMDDDQIVSSSGKENLGGGVQVGVTLTLLDAQLAFEARPGPDYVQCSVSGGNLVAVDANGADISSIYPTAFTQVVVTSSSSATLQNQEALEIASFQGGVAINPNSSISGTTFPAGTRDNPVNNTADAIAIAQSRGLKTLFIQDDLTLTSQDFSSGFVFQGDSRLITLTVDPGANVTNCEFTMLNITGTLDGNNTVRQCIVQNLNYVNGLIFECALEGTITLGGTTKLAILNSWSNLPTDEDVAGPTPTIDLNGGFTDFVLRDYNGGIKLTNSANPSLVVSLDMSSGHIFLDATLSEGVYHLRGAFDLTNNSTGNAVVHEESAQQKVWEHPDALSVRRYLSLS